MRAGEWYSRALNTINSFLQGSDYFIIGWLTGINDVNLMGSDKFAMELYYFNNNVGAPKYGSGLIGGMRIKGPTLRNDFLDLGFIYDGVKSSDQDDHSGELCQSLQ